MAQTQRSNLIVPEIMADAISTGLAGKKALMGTGAAIVNGSLPADKKGGDTVSIPYFNNIGELDDVAEGAALVAAQITGSKETASVQRSGKMLDLTRWAEMASVGDPYAEAAKQFTEGVLRRADKALIAAAQGSTLVNDDSANAFNYDSFVDSKLVLGDEADDIALVAMHSAVVGKLLKLKDTQGRPLVSLDAQESGKIPTYMGMPLKVSDRLVADGSGVYQTLIVKRGALVFWYNGKPSVRTLPDPATDSDVTAINVYYAAYMYRNMPGLSKPGVVVYKHK